MLLSVRAIAVPIICGNTVVFKCSEVTPRTQAVVAEVLFEVSFFAYILERATKLTISRRRVCPEECLTSSPWTDLMHLL